MTIEEVRRRRGRPPKGEPPRREAILHAALAAFARNGYDGTNLREIAAAAEVDVALISHRFGSKLDLWKAVVDLLAQDFLESTAAVVMEGHGLSDIEVLKRALENFIEMTCDRPERALFFVQEISRQDERFEYVYERLLQPGYDYIVPMVRAAHNAGSLRERDPEFYFHAFASSLIMTVAMRPIIDRTSRAPMDEAAFRKQLRRILLSGFNPSE